MLYDPVITLDQNSTAESARVLVFGYFDRKNLGDDLFAVFWKGFLERTGQGRFLWEVVNPDNITMIPSDTRLVILGGGDLINQYFLQRLQELVRLGDYRGPIYAVGVGIAYPNMIEEGCLDQFDIVIHRTPSVHARLLARLGPERVFLAPDLVYALGGPVPGPGLGEAWRPLFLPRARRGVVRLGVALARPLYQPQRHNLAAYQEIVNQIARFLAEVTRVEDPSCWRMGRGGAAIEVFLIAFCTDENPTMDDRVINRAVYATLAEMLPPASLQGIYLIEEPLTPASAGAVFQQFDVVLCTRFHAHVLAALHGVPFISLSCTSKVQELITAYGAESRHVALPLTPDGVPAGFPEELEKKLRDIWKNLSNSVVRRRIACETAQVTRRHHAAVPLLLKRLRWLLTAPLPVTYTPVGTPSYRAYLERLEKRLRNAFVNSFGDSVTASWHDDKLFSQAGGFLATLQENGVESTPEVAAAAAGLVSFHLTGRRLSPYHYGLQEKMLQPDHCLRESIQWIMQDLLQSKLLAHGTVEVLPEAIPTGTRVGCGRGWGRRCESGLRESERSLLQFDLGYLDQHLMAGMHRSGWEEVVKLLAQYHTPGATVLDCYLDRTFGWEADFLTRQGLIPFKREWVGFFHHTGTAEARRYSANNLLDAICHPSFERSLATCRALCTLSQNSATWLREALQQQYPGAVHPPVYALIHPTAHLVPLFNWDLFKAGRSPQVATDQRSTEKGVPRRSVIQVGAWLRNSYAIYDLSVGTQYQKYALVGPQMEGYYPKEEYLPHLQKTVAALSAAGSGNGNGNGKLCRPNQARVRAMPSSNDHHEEDYHWEQCCNKYLVGLYHSVVRREKDVKLISTLAPTEYDTLLTDSVVFVELVDASAVNTVLECLMRATPILINRLPAIEEYLGGEYPLFYDTLAMAGEFLADDQRLKRAHEYLLRRDKTPYTYEAFLRQFEKNFS